MSSLVWRLSVVLLFVVTAQAQTESAGFEMPMTLSGGAFASQRLSARPGSDSTIAGGLRAIAYPTFRVNERWFASGAV